MATASPRTVATSAANDTLAATRRPGGTRPRASRPRTFSSRSAASAPAASTSARKAIVSPSAYPCTCADSEAVRPRCGSSCNAIGAAVAREGARRSQERGDDEHAALAQRLDAEASGLSALGTGQSDILAGAERCAALAPVLKAAGVLDGELESLALVAARGLRQAVRADTLAAYTVRVTALDRRLSRSP